MKTALIIHGIQGHAGIHWQQWLHDELVQKGYKVIMSDLPNPGKPDRKEWLEALMKLTVDIDFSKLVIIAHSLGVTTALDLIEKSGVKIDKLISISGFVEDYGAKLNSYFMKDRDIDLQKVKDLVEKIYVIYGDNDPYVPQRVLKQLADGLGVKPIIIKKGGHLNTDSGYIKIPLLLGLLK
ncbi:RBBP9/YdeN family alpha/beta hydrolase [Patescibacteria group bacterium]